MVRRKSEKKKVVMVEHTVQEERKGDGGVAAALVWRPYLKEQQQEKAKQKPHSASNAKYSKYFPKTPDIGKAKSYGFTCDDSEMAGRKTNVPVDPEDEETVLQALRGWPRLRRSKTSPEMTLPSWERRPGSGGGESGVSGASDATNMPEVMSHAYLRKWLMAKEQKEREAFEAELRKRQEAKRLTLGKHTKASELRTLSIQDRAFRLNKDPRDLWQMPRFRNNARPHLETFRLIQSHKRRSVSSSTSLPMPHIQV